MVVKVYYVQRAYLHCFASCFDDCNFCYRMEDFTFDEAKEQYIKDHARMVEQKNCSFIFITNEQLNK